MLPRVVFMGSPEFALPVLQKLTDHYPVVGVVTQPDRPAGRGQVLTPPPVKALAQELGLQVIQPRRLRELEAMQKLREWAPDLIVVAAFGQILRQEVLGLPKFGCINVHASLLPRWRGAAPIQAAILAGDTESGVTIMRMDAGVDTGDILRQRAIPIDPQDTAESLSQKLSSLGGDLLIDTLPDYLNGQLKPISQNAERATYAGMIKKEAGQLDFKQTAASLARQVRAYYPWPGSFTWWQNQPLKILKAHAAEVPDVFPEKTYIHDRFPAIGTISGVLVLDEVQPAGKRPMPGEVFLRGARGWGTT